MWKYKNTYSTVKVKCFISQQLKGKTLSGQLNQQMLKENCKFNYIFQCQNKCLKYK